VLKSEGNFNNHFGLPLMLLKIEPEHEAAVIEMGMSHRGEIAALAKIAQPEIGVVTNVAPVHLEFFKSVAEIARAKYELIASLPTGGTAVLNADDEYVSQFGRDFPGKVVLYGLHQTAEIRAENIVSARCRRSTFDVVAGACREPASLPLVGTHNIYNALAAVATAWSRPEPRGSHSRPGDPGPCRQKRGGRPTGQHHRHQRLLQFNPTALDAMVDTLAAMPAKRHIVVAGEMLELGPAGEELHRRSGQHMGQKGIDILVGVRGLAQPMVEAASHAGIRAEFVATPEEAGEWLARETREGDVVLLKASRGVKLERALEAVVGRQSSVVGKSRTAGD
jgi:UDP-N-acetylmuramoyl-tripeptide--D-alanyl-D-alanine ligase